MRYAKQRDKNHAEIRDALRKAGCSVIESDIVDLIVGVARTTYILEVKRPDRRSESNLRPVQKMLRDTWRGQYAIVSTVEEAFAAVGIV